MSQELIRTLENLDDKEWVDVQNSPVTTNQMESIQVIQSTISPFKWYLFSKHLKFDLVVDQFHGIPFFTPLYVRTKKLAFIHEVTKEVWKLNPWSWPFNIIAAFVGEIFEPMIFKLYKKVLFMTVSNSTRSDLITWGIPRDQITVIHNGVKIPKITNNFKKENKKTLIFLGALSRDKGVEQALKVFQLIEPLNHW